MKSVVITQSNYIPWKGYFDAINTVDEFVLYDEMQYTKRDWRNRNKIKTPNGSEWLTIPVEVKGKYFQRINETRISDLSWSRTHWKTIMHNYAKAQYFNQLAPFFEELYLSCNLNSLSEVNFYFLTNLCKLLDIKTTIIPSGNFTLLEGKVERLVGICKQSKADVYYSGPAAKNYIDESQFRKEGITVNYFNYENYPEYQQLFGTFIHEVSIIDMLFNIGVTETKAKMKSF